MRSFFLGDLTLCEKIFVPVHVRSEDYWILLIVKMKGIIEIWDSLHGGKSVGNEILKEAVEMDNKKLLDLIKGFSEQSRKVEELRQKVSLIKSKICCAYDLYRFHEDCCKSDDVLLRTSVALFEDSVNSKLCSHMEPSMEKSKFLKLVEDIVGFSSSDLDVSIIPNFEDSGKNKEVSFEKESSMLDEWNCFETNDGDYMEGGLFKSKVLVSTKDKESISNKTRFARGYGCSDPYVKEEKELVAIHGGFRFDLNLYDITQFELSALVVNMVVDLLCDYEAKLRGHSMKFWFIPTSISRPYLEEGAIKDPTNLRRWVGDISVCEKMFMPLLAMRHWLLTIVSIVDESVYVYDDLRVVTPALGLEIISDFLVILDLAFPNAFSIHLGRSFKFEKFIIMQKSFHKKQCVDYDCGIYVKQLMRAAYTNGQICVHGHQTMERVVVSLAIILSSLNKMRLALKHKGLPAKGESQIFDGIFRCYAVLIAALIVVAEMEWGFILKFWQDKWIVAAEKLEIFKDPIELVREDLVGKQFLTFEDAEFFIHQYSNMIGFSLRKGKVKRQFGGAIKYRQWVCSKEGHRELKWIKNLNRKREPRAITRVGCKFLFRVSLRKQDGKWYCKEFRSTHSHPLVIVGHRQFIRSNRIIPDGMLMDATCMKSAGIKTCQIYSYMAELVGGYGKLSFLPKDLYNRVAKNESVHLKNADAARAIGYFQHKADHDVD
ncbi:hypothetical protein G4B88_006144 [Cannabis sativa]|uniref:Ubiquitin-like protease family profile domain-containing protein n=1 Tax=Cannabis sativa TaxID=3483 RepID=A0A7J6ICF2_CANSA|nr:hypothetical protein G4B88_006144 [Cannabis sativa]